MKRPLYLHLAVFCPVVFLFAAAGALLAMTFLPYEIGIPASVIWAILVVWFGFEVYDEMDFQFRSRRSREHVLDAIHRGTLDDLSEGK